MTNQLKWKPKSRSHNHFYYLEDRVCPSCGEPIRAQQEMSGAIERDGCSRCWALEVMKIL